MSKEKMNPMLDLENIPAEEKLKHRNSEKEVAGWIADLVGNFTDSIIVYPSPWMDTLPEDIKKQVPLERLLLQMQYHKGLIKEMTATDAEALLYLYPASLEFPFDETWTNIYIHLGAKVCGSMGREVPEDLKVRELTSYQEGKLEHLKRWIYEQRVKHRKEKERDVRREEKEEREKAAPEVIQHAFKLD